MRRVGLCGHLVEDFLSRLDRMGMAVSIEGRAPLLDQNVVDLACAWPVEELVRDGKGKAPLRELVGRFYPREIIDRPKQGYCAPTLNWLRGEAFEVAQAALGELEGMPLLSVPALEQLRRHPPSDRRAAARLWGLVSLSRWWCRMRSRAPQTTPA